MCGGSHQKSRRRQPVFTRTCRKMCQTATVVRASAAGNAEAAWRRQEFFQELIRYACLMSIRTSGMAIAGRKKIPKKNHFSA